MWWDVEEETIGFHGEDVAPLDPFQNNVVKTITIPQITINRCYKQFQNGCFIIIFPTLNSLKASNRAEIMNQLP